jgi:hypothetical protein
MKEEAAGGTCTMHGEMKYSYRALVRKAQKKRQLRDLGVDKRIILKWILRQ